MKSNFLLRGRVIVFCLIIFSVALLLKLFLVQVARGNVYSDKADHQYATPSANIYERGTIYFATKDGQLVSAATQASGFKIAINLEKITNGENIYQALAKIVTIDHAEFIKDAKPKCQLRLPSMLPFAWSSRLGDRMSPILTVAPSV